MDADTFAEPPDDDPDRAARAAGRRDVLDELLDGVFAIRLRLIAKAAAAGTEPSPETDTFARALDKEIKLVVALRNRIGSGAPAEAASPPPIRRRPS